MDDDVKQAAELTQHQKKILAAMQAIGGPTTRYRIGMKFSRQGVQLRHMQALCGAGLVWPVHPITVRLVVTGICRCGCDEWLLTKAGKSAASELKVNWVAW